MVAKSYQNKEIVGEPYTVMIDKRGAVQYVKIKTGRTNPDGSPVIKEVRWYSEEEYYKMYPQEMPQIVFDAKKGFGFDKGYIWIFGGDTYSELEWFRACPVTRYARHFGWYVVSTDELPNDIPEGVEPIKLMWEQVSDGNDNILDEDKIKSIVRDILHPIDTRSTYQGEIGGKITVTAKCTMCREVYGPYGISVLHNFVDANGNIYVWFTQKSLESGKTYTFSAKVKDHKEYRNQQQTIIYYLRNIKEVENA